MPESPSSSGPSHREQTIQALCDHFAQDALTVDEFERRVDLAHRASTSAELMALLADLPVTPPVPLQESPVSAPLPSPADIRPSQTMVALMAGVERKGRWIPARNTRVLAFWGGVELDFREALLGPGVTEVTIACLMGGVEIVVPPDIIVEADGIAIMGGFSHRTPGSGITTDSPVLRITGFALMGGVDIQTRLRGETAKDARRREREERKQKRNRQ